MTKCRYVNSRSIQFFTAASSTTYMYLVQHDLIFKSSDKKLREDNMERLENILIVSLRIRDHRRKFLFRFIFLLLEQTDYEVLTLQGGLWKLPFQLFQSDRYSFFRGCRCCANWILVKIRD